MKGGFSFCGIDIEDVGLNYAPENKDTYVYRPGTSNIHEETFEGHDGGYNYGATKEPKEFLLRCYYEDEHIARGLMAKAHNLFKVGKSGILIFKRRPWVYYYATVTNVNTDDMYSYLNGLFVITMKAYYPVGRGVEINGKLLSNTYLDPYHGEIMLNTAMLDDDSIVPATSFTSITQQKEIVLFNPGTERAEVSIVISGQAGDGVTIYNKTTDQLCKYVAFNTSGSEYVYTDAISGKTVLDSGSNPLSPTNNRRLAFLYHDFGYIELEPAFPILREIFVNYSSNSVIATNILYQDEEEREWYTGKYIYLDKWRKIQECSDEHTIVLEGVYPETSGSVQTSIVLMNELIITPTEGSNLTKLNFIYKPTYS